MPTIREHTLGAHDEVLFIYLWLKLGAVLRGHSCGSCAMRLSRTDGGQISECVLEGGVLFLFLLFIGLATVIRYEPLWLGARGSFLAMCAWKDLSNTSADDCDFNFVRLVAKA